MESLKLPPVIGKDRLSDETDRRYLLADSTTTSAANSILDYGDGDRTPRAHSPAPSASTQTQEALTDAANQATIRTRHASIADPVVDSAPRPYRGFPSEEHYLAALRAWADSKQHVSMGKQVSGFYGPKTMQEYANAPRPEGLGLRKKWRARKAEREEKRRASAA